MTFVPSDQAARDRARDAHETSLVLVAGAGTGKTTLLVDRIEALVLGGRATLLDIAAVTFTENAAGTMKLRLRERLERARSDSRLPPAERARAHDALEVLERAQVSTIHALCAAILQERPLECRVSPGFRVADEAETDALFAQAWDEWLAERLDAGDAVLSDAVRAGIVLEAESEYGDRGSLRGLARALLEERDLAPLVSRETPDPGAWAKELRARAARAEELLSPVAEDDSLVPELRRLVDFARALNGIAAAERGRYLASLPRLRSNLGRKSHWAPEGLEEARRIAFWTGEARSSWAASLGSDLHARLVGSLLGLIARYEEKKRDRGVLDFLDLLVKARDALRDSESVRRHFASRFRHVIIDEFQDTDPLQVEIAERLTGEAGGRLVVVGDAKQSIYRFRRAEVALFRRLAESAASRPDHAVLHLTQSFRSRAAILRFVNRAFSRLIEASLETDQPAYEPIDPPPDPEDVPSVLALRFPAPAFADSGPELLGAEAAALAAFARRVAEGEFTVRDPREGVPRPSRAGDLMVLAPRLTQVRYLEEALGEEDLRFTVEGGKSFFGRQEVHEVLAVLRSIDDVSDRVSLVAALRSSFFGVSDAEIVAHFLARGRLHLAEGRDAGSETSLLASALETLWALHRARLTLSVPALVERLYDDTRVLAALTTLRRGEAQVANLQKVVALARHAESLGILTLRGFTRLLEERSAGALEEPDLPTTRPGDEETVRILSIHKAKGLEAPVVALYDQAANLQTRSDVIPLWSEGKVAVGFVEGFRPPGWKRLQEQDRGRALAEGRRLLYVACTRARDLLVVPRPPRDARTGSFWRDLWPFLDASPPSDVIVLDADTIPRSADEGPPERPAPSPPPESDLSAERWVRAREETVRMASRRPLAPVAATRFAARLAPPPVDAPVGGPGREFGRLVHRILEWIPLDASGRAEAMALALAPRFGLDDDAAREAADQVIRTLAHPILERARRADRCWRELPLWLPEGDELVEGVVDMVFQEVRGLVIVDYKTDHILAAQALAQAAHHAGQLQVYGRGLAHAAGLPVVERLVLFTVLGQAVPV